MEKLPKMNWLIELGDGTGCSITDAQIRNQNGICSILGCNKKLANDAVSYGLLQKLCSDHEIEHKNLLREWFSWDKDILINLNINR